MPDPVDNHERARQIADAVKSADDKRRSDAEHFGEVLDKLLEKVDGMARRVDAMEADVAKRARDDTRKRDDIKRKRKADDDDDDDEKEKDDGTLRVEHGDRGADDDEHTPMAEQPYPELAREVVADRRRSDSSMSRADAERAREHRLSEIQFRHDELANLFGERSPKPMSGETERNYLVRLTRRWQKYSPEWKDIPLETISDPKILAAAENRIIADAQAASARPDVAVGQLRPRVRRLPSGHTEICWFGDPHVWLDPFGGTRSFVTKINRKFDKD